MTAPTGTTPTPTRTGSTRLAGVAVAGWSLVVTGVGHTALVIASSFAAVPGDEQRAREAMGQAVLAMGGLERDLWQLYQGFSLLMALLLVGLGALNLVLLRRQPGAFLADRAVLWLDLAILVPAWGLAIVLLPPPPILLLGVALVAVAVALTARPVVRRTASAVP